MQVNIMNTGSKKLWTHKQHFNFVHSQERCPFTADFAIFTDLKFSKVKQVQ